MTKRALTVGERVRVYGNTQIGGITCHPIPKHWKATVKTAWKDGWPKQCRRLKPKPQKERGERKPYQAFAIVRNGVLYETCTTKDSARHMGKGLLAGKDFLVVRLAECPEDSVPVSREALAKAWTEAFGAGNVFKDAMPRLVKNLGLPEAKS